MSDEHPVNTELPKVSVVMSVLDKPINVLLTIRSVLQQEGIDLEYLIVLDGASPLVEQMLRVYARDQRVRIIKQENRGLTLSLIHGCRLASHEYIARIDAGDSMEPGRLAKQVAVLVKKDDVGFVSSYVEVHTDEGYHLYDVKDDRKVLIRGLAAQQSGKFKAPVHSATMFRKSFYEQVGGYRKAFFCAQDADLWARLIEVSQLVVLPEILTSVICSADSISGRMARYQHELITIVIEATSLRASGEPDKPLLRKASKLKKSAHPIAESQREYMINIAASLSRQSSRHAKEYWWRVLKMKPWALSVWPSLVASWFMRG